MFIPFLVSGIVLGLFCVCLHLSFQRGRLAARIDAAERDRKATRQAAIIRDRLRADLSFAARVRARFSR